jgi:hypothetical protein
MLVLAAGCSRRDSVDEHPGGTTTLTSASFTTRESAVDRIVAARCAREVTCMNLGPDKHFATSDKCVGEVKQRMNAELSDDQCPDGIDAKAVDECLDAIRNESCSNPLATVERLSTCRVGNLCLKPMGRPLL